MNNKWTKTFIVLIWVNLAAIVVGFIIDSGAMVVCGIVSYWPLAYCWLGASFMGDDSDD